MVDRIEAARRLVSAAADDADDATVREQLRSVERGFRDLDDEPADSTTGDRLEELEATLTGLGSDVDDDVRRQLEDARDHVDAYRRDRAQDW